MMNKGKDKKSLYDSTDQSERKRHDKRLKKAVLSPIVSNIQVTLKQKGGFYDDLFIYL